MADLQSRRPIKANDDGLSMIDRFNKTGSFLPRGVAYAISDGLNGLRMVTYADQLAVRKKRQAEHTSRLLHLEDKRRSGYVWTFYQPGLFGFAYQGWWAYLRILGHDDMKLTVDEGHLGQSTALRAMEMFPCGILPVRENFELWKETFGKEFSRPGRFKKQGLVPVWVCFEGHHVNLDFKEKPHEL